MKGAIDNISQTHLCYLDDFEAQVAFVQHDDLIIVCAIINHVPQREQRVAAGQHGLTPSGVTLVADHQAAAVVRDGFVQDGHLLCLLQTREVILLGGKVTMKHSRARLDQKGDVR